MNGRDDHPVTTAAAPTLRFRGNVAVGPERVVVFDMPVDITDAEILAFLATFATQVRASLITQRAAPRSRLLVPV